MANRILTVISCLLALECSATGSVYTVGDSSGWDISTDLDSWPRNKSFAVGDTLLFQYSQYYSVSEVTGGNYDACNATAAESHTDGNTSVQLTRPGRHYFITGNELYCLASMKLNVDVAGNQTTSTPPPVPPANTAVFLPPANTAVVLPPPRSSSSSTTTTAATTLLIIYDFHILGWRRSFSS
ncbi:hypothetical protein M569_14263 [Genlisea aurea]|uniref:Phytocyanin domain-containing protein n=1 Tax=Genlisea aurea TaxID=192259 RepID=S8C184_9LAMI|nr:hypothetical protein M569_14263 [Genlisea aurea]